VTTIAVTVQSSARFVLDPVWFSVERAWPAIGILCAYEHLHKQVFWEAVAAVHLQ
jgi:hypothetical protein